MICKVCGAQNEEGSNYCKICAAPLKDSTPVSMDDSPRYVDPPANVNATAGDMRSSWGFVRAPKWPKPNFDADSIAEEDLPAAPVKRQPSQSTAAPRYASAQAPRRSTTYEEEAEQVSAPRKSAAAPTYRSKGGYASDEDFGYDDYEEPPQHDALYSMDDEDDFEPVAPRSRVSAVRRTRDQRREMEFEDDYEDDYEHDDYDYDEKPSFRDHRGSRSSRGGLSKTVKSVLFWVVAAVLVIIIALFALILIYKDKGGLPAFFGNVFSGSTVTRDPVMEPTTMDDGSPAYAVTIYAKDGSIVRFTYPNGDTTDIPVKNGQAAARVPVSVWTPTDPVEASPVSVKPNFSVVDADGTITPVDLPEIQIEVPAITVTLSQPTGAELESDTTALAFAGTVSDPAAAIFVNDQQFAVNADGSFSGTYELGATGTHVVSFEGRKGGCVIGRQEVSVTVTETAPEQTVTASSVTLAEDGILRSTGSTLTVKGTMEPGSTITATGDVSGEPNVDSAAGTFSFTASTPDTGKQYSVTITATKDGKTTTKEFHIERAPDYKEYVEGAWRMDYDHILATPTQSQAYACKGTIVEMIENTREKVLAKMDVGDGDLVVIEYHPAYATAGTLEVSDNSYTIYAYPNGLYEDSGLPLMYAWFVND